MATMFTAIEKLKYMQPAPIFRKHTRVVQVEVESRKFKCLDCGETWIETFHAPLIVSASEADIYYPQATSCKTLK